MCYWNLDDEERYFKLFTATIPYAYTWGCCDKERRENIRRESAGEFPGDIPKARWWALRIFAEKQGDGWDVDNLSKLVVDAFCGKQLRDDNSEFSHMEIYKNDTVEFVRMVQVAGEQSKHQDRTVIEVFGAY